jgi:hypothetical protein
MSTLAFRCRNTRQQVDSGIEADSNGAPKMAVSAFRLRCPVCDERHAWLITEGQVIKRRVNKFELIFEQLVVLRDRLAAA